MPKNEDMKKKMAKRAIPAMKKVAKKKIAEVKKKGGKY